MLSDILMALLYDMGGLNFEPENLMWLSGKRDEATAKVKKELRAKVNHQKWQVVLRFALLALWCYGFWVIFDHEYEDFLIKHIRRVLDQIGMYTVWYIENDTTPCFLLK
jgi:hypothetical protein